MEPRKPSFITYAPPHGASSTERRDATRERPGDHQTERFPEHPEREPKPPHRPLPPLETQAIPEHPEREPKPPHRPLPKYETQAIPEHAEREPR